MKQLLVGLWAAVVAVGVAQGGEVAHPVASPHPYQNDMDASTRVTHPGATSLRLHFRRIDVEQWFDTVYVYDANGQVVAEYSGAYDDVWTPSIPGDTGNMWMGAPPATDRAYTGNGRGLPAAHSHLWFAADPQNHKKLTTWAREALDYSGTYTFGGG